MPAVSISPEDLKPFADIPPDKAQAMIDDAMALAAFYAPCILDPRFEYEAAATAIIRGAILRWNAADTGAVTSQTAGPFSVQVDSSVRRNGMYTEQEIEQLQAMCSDPNAGTNGTGTAWGYDTIPTGTVQQHAEICCTTFNEPHCSCGANLTKSGRPLWDGYAS
jgi:hypothetical protein